MRQFETVQEAYDLCVSGGNIIPKDDVGKDRIKSCLLVAEEDFQSAQDSIDKKRWNSAYKMYYDVLHQLAEVFLRFEKVKVKTHLCLFAYLCVKHPELELSWDFFEKVRTKRNGINYYGNPVSDKDWKEVALQFDLYIKLLKEEINTKLSDIHE